MIELKKAPTNEELLDAANNGLKYVVANLSVLGLDSEADPGKVLDWLKKLPDSVKSIEDLKKIISGEIEEDTGTVQGGYELNPFELVKKR